MLNRERMKRRLFVCTLFAPLLLQAQQPAGSATVRPPKPQFFAGQVTEVSADRVKVSRSLVGRSNETHVFAIDAKTKTPKGGIKLKTRVTVRYEHAAEYDLALEIQVRPVNHAAKST